MLPDGSLWNSTATGYFFWSGGQAATRYDRDTGLKGLCQGGCQEGRTRPRPDSTWLVCVSCQAIHCTACTGFPSVAAALRPAYP